MKHDTERKTGGGGSKEHLMQRQTKYVRKFDAETGRYERQKTIKSNNICKISQQPVGLRASGRTLSKH